MRVHRIVRIGIGVVLRQRRNHRAVGVRPWPWRLARSLHAAQMRAVRVIAQPEARVDEISGGAGIRHHGARQTQLAVAGHREEIELSLGTADQHVGAGDVAAAREVEADERNLAGARGDAAGR